MKQIRLKTNYAHPKKGAHGYGSIITVDEKEAKELIEKGYAEPVESPETTAAPAAPEAAVAPRPSRPRSGESKPSRPRSGQTSRKSSRK